jgi:hypothetical protein
MPRPRANPFRLVLGICPVAVALLWLAGVARFRGYDLEPIEWAAVVAFAFVFHVLLRRLRRPRPLPPLPPGASPNALALLAATILAFVAAIVAGVFEWVVEPQQPTDVPWSLRTTWHAACAFAASYCSFLLRLQQAPRQGGAA